VVASLSVYRYIVLPLRQHAQRRIVVSSSSKPTPRCTVYCLNNMCRGLAVTMITASIPCRLMDVSLSIYILLQYWRISNELIISFIECLSFSLARQPLGGLGRLIFRGFTITHFLDTLHSVGLLWTRDQLVAETST
jgi:hypothetical protein